MSKPSTFTTALTQLCRSRNPMNRLACMTGAYNFVDHGNGASFKFRGNRKANYYKITLDASDTYTAELMKITQGGLKVVTVTKTSGLYCGQLKSHFEQATQMYLSL